MIPIHVPKSQVLGKFPGSNHTVKRVEGVNSCLNSFNQNNTRFCLTAHLSGTGLQLSCERRHRPVVYNHTSAIVLSPNHDSGFGDSNEIPLLSRLRFDSKDFGE